MNKKLKELMIEAGYVWPEGASRAQKLFELVVNECLDICKEREHSNLYGVQEARNEISKRFGVKQ